MRARFDDPDGCGGRTRLLVTAPIGLAIAVLAMPEVAACTSHGLVSQLGEH